jgi:CheY-like chemotaxis protein
MTRSLPELAGKRALLAEDDPDVRYLLVRRLTALGLAVDAAAHGQAALELWQSAPYELLVTDCVMPGLDGYALTRAVRAAESGRGTRTAIIVLTSATPADQSAIALAAGADAQLTKPVSAEVLRAVVLQVLQFRATR